jgi:hypothetical protein
MAAEFYERLSLWVTGEGDPYPEQISPSDSDLIAILDAYDELLAACEAARRTLSWGHPEIPVPTRSASLSALNLAIAKARGEVAS